MLRLSQPRVSLQSAHQSAAAEASWTELARYKYQHGVIQIIEASRYVEYERTELNELKSGRV